MSRPSDPRPGGAHDERKHAALVDDVSRWVRQALLDAIVHIGGGDDDADHAALTVERARVPMAPAQLASAQPGGAPTRQQARALYERCLTHYREVLRAPYADGDRDDVGAAVACFVGANIHALHNVDVTPQMLLRLERQLGGVVRSSAEWATASAHERQLYFEKMAILAVLIGESSAQAVLQGPDAIENVRRAARGYLQQLLGLNPDQLTIGAGGLSLRRGAEPPPSSSNLLA